MLPLLSLFWTFIWLAKYIAIAKLFEVIVQISAGVVEHLLRGILEFSGIFVAARVRVNHRRERQDRIVQLIEELQVLDEAQQLLATGNN